MLRPDRELLATVNGHILVINYLRVQANYECAIYVYILLLSDDEEPSPGKQPCPGRDQPTAAGSDESGSVFSRLEKTRILLEDKLGIASLLEAYQLIQVDAFMYMHTIVKSGWFICKCDSVCLLYSDVDNV